MGKPCYTDYIRHSLRFYCRYHDNIRFRNDVDKQNWQACDHVMRLCAELEQEILFDVYRGYDPIEENVRKTADKFGMLPNDIWRIMYPFERDIAKRRGLI